MRECQICKKYARNTLAEIMRHIRDVHPHFEGPLKCGVKNCPSTVSTYKSLRQHVYEKHKNELKTVDNHDDIQVLERGGAHTNDLLAQSDVTVQDESEHNTDTPSCSHSNPSLFNGETGEQSIGNEAAKFILKTLEGKKLTQTVADGIIGDTTIFVERTLDHLKQKLKEKLGNTFEEIEAIFFLPEICNPFRGLETRYQQEKYFQQHFNYVVSCKGYPS